MLSNRKFSCYCFSALLAVMLTACAVSPPVYDPIQDINFQSPALAAVRAQPNAFLQMPVRWGGSIARIDNRREETWLEVVGELLNERGWPVSSDDNAGRFIARINGFVDPAIYAVGRRVTVVGRVTGTTAGQVGDYRYTYPVVAVEHYRLWPVQRSPEVIYLPGPFLYGPGPWGYRPGPFW